MITDKALLFRNATEACNLLKAMSNPHRLLIMCILSDLPATGAGALATATGLTPSALSQHLAKLLKQGLVQNVRQGNQLLYSLKSEAVEPVINTLKSIYCP
ncbi:MAG: metalloregulator ArsR/SmtB family transcription factor [Rouxiella aceris]|uniref:ArsR/SmtB family transcription factor n=1 Tax=Rouxiella aceris TaxID=2703884 RepID=UPI00283EC002|nr:metalloregulator ArsR/SmtB family transcription factor [Rouxiella aceris]MDR3431626.1 metalloregulator ArsR/SmtB family transcription factor [Rouxiella aceris]